MPEDPKGESFAALFEGEASRTPRRRSFGVGEELDVVVVQVGRDAVFVELDGKQEGFIESKDLVNKSGNVSVKVGSRITARVVETGGRPGAVRLVPVFVRPPQAEEPDAEPLAVGSPGPGVVAVGNRVRGTVAVVERYGVFLQLSEGSPGASRRGVRGLIPTVELGVPRGADLHKLFPVGTELEAKIIAIDERNRIKLSVVALNADAERREFEEHRTKGSAKSDAATKGFGTLGDLLTKKR
ncbi:MAG TPA: S1 RNA-binding domain-containing protein [Polyangiaceae bacterium]